MGRQATGQKPTGRVLSVRGVDSGLWHRLRLYALSERRPVGDVLGEAITLYLQSKGGR